MAVFDTASGAELGRRDFAEPITALGFGADADQVLVGHGTGAVSVVSVASGFAGERVVLGEQPIAALVQSADVVVVADSAGTVSVARLTDAPIWQRLRLGEPCRELIPTDDGSAVVCRTANWLFRVAIRTAPRYRCCHGAFAASVAVPAGRRYR